MKQCLLCDAHYNDAQWICRFCGHEVKYIDGIPALAPEQATEGDGFRPEYFHELAKFEDGNFWFKARNRLIGDVLLRYFPGFRTLLEIGCGTGYVLSGIAGKFPEAKLTGTELFISGLPYIASRVPSAELVQMDAKNIPWVDHFDVIGAFDVLEHIKDDELVIREIHKALRPEGLFILTVPQHEWMWSWQDELACHVRRYPSSEMRDKIKRNGFTLVYQTSFMSLLFPLMWLSRKHKNRSANTDALSELRLGRFMNRLLGGIMKFEHLLIRTGLRFNVGGSLLLVARR
jgi:SAM-dependent methyltransferase